MIASWAYVDEKGAGSLYLSVSTVDSYENVVCEAT